MPVKKQPPPQQKLGLSMINNEFANHPVNVTRAVWTVRYKWAGTETKEGVAASFEVPASPAHPDSVFVEDTAVVYGRHAVVARAGHPTRRGASVCRSG